MLSKWIDRVGEDDQLLHLGDLFMGKQGNPRRWAKVLERMPGQKFLMLGNHDKEKKSFYEDHGWTIVDPFLIVTNKNVRVAFTHIPIHQWTLENREKYVPTSVLAGERWDVNIHGHTHRNGHHPEEGSPFEEKTYINVCVEVTDLAPVQLGSIFPLN